MGKASKRMPNFWTVRFLKTEMNRISVSRKFLVVSISQRDATHRTAPQFRRHADIPADLRRMRKIYMPRAVALSSGKRLGAMRY